tara:strand:- start:141 stop:740 length:600 start_codon:yes stop_codon:yes gene_type:complete
MKHVQTIPICANSLFIYKLDIKKDLTPKFKKEKFESAQYTDRDSVFISKDLNVLRKYKELNKEIIKAVNTTLKEVLMLENINYIIFSSWLTKTELQGSPDAHNHANSWLSGVYYPKGDPGFGIKFYNDHKTQFFTPPTKYNIYNSGEWNIIPEDNYLILFFSQLRHKIMLNNSNECRYSLAFNILPKGKFGAGDSTVIF